MLGKFRTGNIVSADGAENIPRSDRQGALVMAQAHGKYTEASFRQKLFYSFTSARATSVPATAMIGNIVWNPPGSGVVLSLTQWTAQIQVTSAACLGIGLAYGAQALVPTSITVADSYGSTFLSDASPGACRAKAYAVATLLVVPTMVMNLYHNTAAIATTGVDIMRGDVDGLFTVPSGYVVCLAALGAAVTASGMTSTLVWEEIPE